MRLFEEFNIVLSIVFQLYCRKSITLYIKQFVEDIFRSWDPYQLSSYSSNVRCIAAVGVSIKFDDELDYILFIIVLTTCFLNNLIMLFSESDAILGSA